MSQAFLRAITAALVGALMAPQAMAEIKRPDKPNGRHAVWVYQTVCFDPMPNKSKLEAIAKRNKFRPITGSALKPLAPEAPHTYFKAWQFEDLNRTFKVAVSVSAVEPGLAKVFPKYVNGNGTACSVFLPGKNKPTEVYAAMTKLMQRDADEAYIEGAANQRLWISETDENVFVIYHISQKSGEPGGVLSVLTLAK